MRLDLAMRTDKGLVRDNNEDAIGGDAAAGLVILADGMGGANAGEVASGLAVDLLMNRLLGVDPGSLQTLPRADLLESIQDVNYAILDLAQQVPEYHGMGTTLVVGLFQPGHLICAHVGDSRLYRYRHGVLEAFTRDHTLIEELVRLGEFASTEDALAAGVPQNILSRAFGSDPDVEIEITELDAAPGDLFVFCSDGLTNMVSASEMEEILRSLDDELMTGVDALIERACAKGGIDNVSVILARVLDNQE